MATRHLYYLGLYCKQGLALLWRNRFLSLVSGLVVGSLLVVVYAALVLSAQTRMALEKVDDHLTVAATIKQDSQSFRSVVPPQQLARQVQALPLVKEVRVISEEENRDILLRNVKNLKTKPALYLFPETLEIKVHDVERIEEVKQQVERLPGIQHAEYLAALVSKLTSLSQNLKRYALYVPVLLALIAALVVMAMVRAAIHAERRSVETMASVGGSTWTIAAPLVVHMVTVTVIASTAACLLGWWLDPYLGNLASSDQAPEWLRIGRAYGLLSLWPALTLASCAAVTAIVAYGTWRHARA